MIRIAKRDEHLVPFDKKKIVNAINKAFIEVDGVLYETDTATDIANDIEDILYHIDETTDTPVSVEHVQDLVEDFLMRSDRRDVARAYIRYRYKKEVARNHSDEFIGAIAEKLEARDVQNQNANVDERSFGGRIGEASNLLMEKYALEHCVSKRTRQNHLENKIYIHDLSAYAVGMHNCLSIPIDGVAAHGVNTRQVDIRPCKSFGSFSQVSAVVMQLQSLQQFGGVSYTHYDWSSVPYVRLSFTKHLGDGLIYLEGKSQYKLKRFHKWLEHDPEHPDGTIHMDDEEFKNLHPAAWEYAMDMTEKEVYQGIEALYHNLNTLQSRSGNQLPFSSINYGTCTLPEGRMVIKALLEVSIEGLGALHKTSIFPCGIFQCMKGVNRAPGEPNYDLYRLALRSTAQRLYPNYANVDWSGNAGYDVNDPTTYFSTMGCRTANGWDVNGFGQKKDGRGNIAPTTIILPTIAMLAKEELLEHSFNQNLSETQFQNLCVDRFINDLTMYIGFAKDSLIERFEWIASQDASAAKFMYENGLMAGYVPEEGIRSALKHGTLAIGQLGLAETLQILVNCDHTTDRGMQVAKRIEQLFKDKCAEYKEQYKLNFGVYYTPKKLGLGVAQVTAC